MPAKTDSALRQLLGYEHFTLTEHPNTVPTSGCCPGSPAAWFGGFVSSQHVRFAFNQGCDFPSYVAAVYFIPPVRQQGRQLERGVV